MDISVLDALNKEEDFIFYNERSFMEELIGSRYSDLTDVSFSWKAVDIDYLDTVDGLYVHSLIPITRYLEWKQGLTSNP
jgi:hypothetical protein